MVFSFSQETGKKCTSVGVIILLALDVLGEMDEYPEVAFYMVGDIEEVKTKAEKLAAEM